MQRRNFLKSIVAFSAAATGKAFSNTNNNKPEKKIKLLNPYSGVNWNDFQPHIAALHIHTLQSDGRQSVKDVVEGYKRAGFTIMSITDHDHTRPNIHVPREVPKEKASPYPKDPKPENYPANTTWQWTDYGCKSPKELGMVGIEGNELTYRHHMNSYFNDYGVWYEDRGRTVPFKNVVDENGKEVWEDDQIAAVARKGGLIIINHPGIGERSWWERKSLDWYTDRYKNHSFEHLIGIEITNCSASTQPYDLGLWDQLLAKFMPQRPIWGFGNDDMHHLNSTKQTFNVFYLAELTSANIRKAMESGQFCACQSTRRMDYTKQDEKVDIFPSIKNIEINDQAQTVTITADNCDQIDWFTCPVSAKPIGDYKTSNQPWHIGEKVHTGTMLNYRLPSIKRYVRAELIRKDGEHTQRLFTNPFGVVI